MTLASAHKTYLPVATTAADPPAPPVETTAFRGTETVLVVEDQAGVPAVIEQTLHRFGYTGPRDRDRLRSGRDSTRSPRPDSRDVDRRRSAWLERPRGRASGGCRSSHRACPVPCRVTPRMRSFSTACSRRGSRSFRNPLPARICFGGFTRCSRRSRLRRSRLTWPLRLVAVLGSDTSASFAALQCFSYSGNPGDW